LLAWLDSFLIWVEKLYQVLKHCRLFFRSPFGGKPVNCTDKLVLGKLSAFEKSKCVEPPRDAILLPEVDSTEDVKHESCVLLWCIFLVALFLSFLVFDNSLDDVLTYELVNEAFKFDDVPSVLNHVINLVFDLFSPNKPSLLGIKVLNK